MNKRFIDNGYEAINEQSLTDTYTDKTYWVDNGIAEIVDLLNDLEEEKDYWKKRALLLENKYNEGDSVKWLREHTVWEQMPTNTKTYKDCDKNDQ